MPMFGIKRSYLIQFFSKFRLEKANVKFVKKLDGGKMKGIVRDYDSFQVLYTFIFAYSLLSIFLGIH